jgi:predicted enzyme related to lactoylglutathione lyase
MDRVGAAVVGWQIVAQAPEAVAHFYRDVFGWTLSADNALGYRELRSGDAGGISGGVWAAPEGVPTFVQLVIEVADVQEQLERAAAAGATVIVPLSALPDGDSMAVLLDPAGISFILKAARAGATATP